MLSALRDRYLRIDARSLGLFRIAFAIALLADLGRRWDVLDAFYSNDGVLPNHNHLFNLGEDRQVWSFLHSFSNAGDTVFAFICIGLAYLFFLVGYKTRVFHLLSLVCIVSLTARNTLAENPGNYAAIALCAFTLFLPLGRRFSIDALVTSMGARSEKSAAQLNDRSGEEPDFGVDFTGDEERAAGYSPTSIAALAATLQVAIIFMASAYQHSGEAWKDGSAIGIALASNRWASAFGASMRGSLPSGLFTSLVRYTELAVPVLLFVPVARSVFRGISMVLMIAYGLIFACLFSLGLYGETLVAAAFLMAPAEMWDARKKRASKKPTLLVIYDADCGVCLWLARLLSRLDLDHRVRFRGNDTLDDGDEKPDAEAMATGHAKLPKEVTAALASETIIVLDANGKMHTRADAIATILFALPLGWLPGIVLKIPGLSNLADVLYDAFAKRRMKVSEAAGLGACGIPAGGEQAPDAPTPVAPSRRLARRISATARELVVAAMLASMITQTGQENPISWLKMSQPHALASIAIWPRMIGRWDVMAPEPARENVAFVVDGLTKGAGPIDPMTGVAPVMDVAGHAPFGEIWADYLDRVHRKDYAGYQKALKDYLAKGYPNFFSTDADKKLTGFDAFWVTQPEGGEPVQEKLFTHSRGGSRINLDRRLPALSPSTLKIEKKD